MGPGWNEWTSLAAIVLTVGGAIVVFMRVYGRMESDLKNVSKELAGVAMKLDEWVKESRRTVERWGSRLGELGSRVDRIEGAMWDRRYRRIATPAPVNPNDSDDEL